ncbi:uncharacterized protein LOC144324197 isoform X2 [Canis aureus]
MIPYEEAFAGARTGAVPPLATARGSLRVAPLKWLRRQEGRAELQCTAPGRRGRLRVRGSGRGTSSPHPPARAQCDLYWLVRSDWHRPSPAPHYRRILEAWQRVGFFICNTLCEQCELHWIIKRRYTHLTWMKLRKKSKGIKMKQES